MNLNKFNLVKTLNEAQKINKPKFVSSEKDFFIAKILRKIAFIDILLWILIFTFLLFTFFSLVILLIFKFSFNNSSNDFLLSVICGVFFVMMFLSFLTRFFLVNPYIRNKMIIYDFIDVFNDKSIFVKLIYKNNFWFWAQILLNPIWSILHIKFILKYTKTIIRLFKNPYSKNKIEKLNLEYDKKKLAIFQEEELFFDYFKK